jgi:hypothetical protein
LLDILAVDGLKSVNQYGESLLDLDMDARQLVLA